MLPTPLRAHLPLFLYLGLGLTGCGQAGRADGEEAGGGGGIVLDEQVRVIDDVDEVIVEADRLRFPVATHAELADLAAGVVVVGDRQGAGSQRNGNPDGFLRRVLGAGVVGDEVVLRTEMASLMDVVDEGQISTVIDVPGGAPVGLVEAANGTLRARRPGVVLGSGPDLVRRQYAPFPPIACGCRRWGRWSSPGSSSGRSTGSSSASSRSRACRWSRRCTSGRSSTSPRGR